MSARHLKYFQESGIMKYSFNEDYLFDPDPPTGRFKIKDLCFLQTSFIFSKKEPNKICSKSDLVKCNHKAALRIVTKILAIQRGSENHIRKFITIFLFFLSKLRINWVLLRSISVKLILCLVNKNDKISYVIIILFTE